MELSSNDRTLFSLVFSKFKPLCDSLVTLLTRQSINTTNNNNNNNNEQTTITTEITNLLQSLYEKIDQTEPKPLSLLLDYLYIPIVLLLSPNKVNNQTIRIIISRDNIQCQSLQLLNLITTKLSNYNLDNQQQQPLYLPQTRQFVEIIQLLCNIIFNSIVRKNNNLENEQQQQQQKSEIQYNLSEEYLIELLDCIRSVYQWWTPVCKSMETAIDSKGEIFITLAFSISTLLDLLVAKSISRNSKLTVTHTLEVILNPLLTNNKQQPIVESILPATSTTLFKLIISDYKLGTNIKIQSLKLFTNLIVSAFTTNNNNNSNSNFDINDMLTDDYKITTTTTTTKTPPAATTTRMSMELSQSEKNIFKFISVIFPHSNSYSKLRNVDIDSQRQELEQQFMHSNKQKQQRFNYGGFMSTPLKWSMKVALVECAERLIMVPSLHSTLPILLETLVWYSLDDYEEVSTIARNRLSILKQQNGMDIQSLLLENFNHLVQAMPRLICGTEEHKILEEEKKEAIAKLVLSYIKTIDTNSLDSFLNVRMELISTVLLQLLEMKLPSSGEKDEDDSNSLISKASKSLEETLKVVSDNPFNRNSNNSSSNKRLMEVSNKLVRPYIHIQTEQLEHWIFEIIREVAKSIALTNWIDVLLSNSTLSRSPLRKEIILVMNQLMIGSTQQQQQQQQQLPIDFSTIMYLLDEYLEPELMNLPISNPSDDYNTININNNNNSNNNNNKYFEQYLDNTILQSLIIEGIGSMAPLLKNKKHQTLFISKVLYHLMEKFGVASHDTTGILMRSCRLALNNITSLFNYDSLEDIVYKNSDYLLDKIESNMKYLHSYPNTPNVFEGILNITGMGFLPFLKDTVEIILFSLDVSTENSESIIIFIKILYNIIRVLYNNSKLEIEYNQNQQQLLEQQRQQQRDGEEEKMMDLDDNMKESNSSSISDIKSFFMNHHQQKQLNEQEHNYWGGATTLKEKEAIIAKLQKQRNSRKAAVGKDEFKTTTETQRQLLSDIIHKCKHFLGSRSRAIKMATLDIMDMGLLIVSTGNRNYGGDEDEQEEEVETDGDDMSLSGDDLKKTPRVNPVTANDKKPKVALFPLIHSIWPSIIKRIEQTDDRATSKRALELIQSITKLSKDFIAQRFWTDLFPILKKIIQRELKQQQRESTTTTSTTTAISLLDGGSEQQRESSKISFNIVSDNQQQQQNQQLSGSSTTAKSTKQQQPLITPITETKDLMAAKSMKFTPSFKIQSIILDSLLVIIQTLKLNQQQLIEVARLTLPYLSSTQPESFQSTTVDIWKILLEKDYDSLWLLLFNFSGQFQNYQSPPHPSLKPLPRFHTFNEYKVNSLKLLK
ncbi:hypothetical protein PPL_12231 [Heterostelium album PN500]|uniref:TTI1 C-terminal TPR domain-containing protein n=1 Tax=Heterostelium pallidum (strain ATCC 26659 / Pp 5 / PN500) TaxID=670386 RepID=D3BM23_HETP5|nr:hypothetical protein PPL_12231 [Heterostelium album PN500]EFA77624.1 hypothetical protein PPL_12231 [Heterostelium album PN500]|eukprot:XP_020429752.1 hypothetical protein PPL_12231 [Heterostelium album PN500]